MLEEMNSVEHLSVFLLFVVSVALVVDVANANLASVAEVNSAVVAVTRASVANVTDNLLRLLTLLVKHLLLTLPHASRSARFFVATLPAESATLETYAVLTAVTLKHAHTSLAPFAKVAMVKAKSARQ
jgi:hypothetical protein